MPILPIRIAGDPVLHAPAQPVERFDTELETLVADMVETMRLAPGVGLAAPQVGRALRVFVYEWTDEDEVTHAGTAVNPELLMHPLVPGEPDEEDESEGCLSFPGERFPLRRSGHVELRAQDVGGAPYTVTADGWLARIFQHEFDHLDGVLYVDRLGHPFDRAAAKIARKRSWYREGLAWTPGIDHLDA